MLNGSSIVKEVLVNQDETFMGSLIVDLTGADEISLGIKSSAAVTLTLSTGISAYLNVVKLK